MKYFLIMFYMAQLNLGQGSYLGWPNVITGAHKSGEFSLSGEIRDIWSLRRTEHAVAVLKMEGTLEKKRATLKNVGGLELLWMAQHGIWNLRPRATGNWSLPTNWMSLEPDSVAEPLVRRASWPTCWFQPCERDPEKRMQPCPPRLRPSELWNTKWVLL